MIKKSPLVASYFVLGGFMIYLIGGSSHVGKTYISQLLMERNKVPYISIDHIKMMFIRCGLTKLTPDDDYEMRYFLWPYLAEYIKTAIENNQSFIMEGCYIPENFRDAFSQEYLSKIKVVYIVMSEAYIRKNFDLIVSKASVIENRLCDEPDMDRLIECSMEFSRLGHENKIPVYEISNEYNVENIVSELEEIMNIS